MIADTATYHYFWNALMALAPVALGAFLGGLLIAWGIWGLLLKRGRGK